VTGKAFDDWTRSTGKPETEIAAAAGVSQPVVNKARRGRSISLSSVARLCRAAEGALQPEQFPTSPEDAATLRFLRQFFTRRQRRRKGPRRLAG
jgi:hypothetical protein